METNGRQNNQPNAPIAVLTIVYNKDKSYKVDGPINDPTLAFGMIEVAKVVIMDNIRKQNASKIIPVTANLDQVIRRG